MGYGRKSTSVFCMGRFTNSTTFVCILIDSYLIEVMTTLYSIINFIESLAVITNLLFHN
ncbi:hypothetical protein P280DRAFT_161736 [Massarina eburnea CBS 473.64]|uniref:Uncharacterized protein n=1 Tax=Massarina eburnea CBS 473.64 TaxID=1395130 RepID=A0A6A6RM69_9PLEO|nr:hypothetical protein P280DRAFT_161736 [Massarina eburnea CBS 473.64]